MYTKNRAGICDDSDPSWRSSAIGIYRFWRDTGCAVRALVTGAMSEWVGITGPSRRVRAQPSAPSKGRTRWLASMPRPGARAVGGTCVAPALVLVVLAAWVGVAAGLDECPAAHGALVSPCAPQCTILTLQAGYGHTCALFEHGGVRCWGRNHYGQLGRGNTATIGDDAGEVASLADVDLGLGRTVVQLAAGYQHSCALRDDGHLKCWGDNSVGQLGLSDVDNRGDGADEMGARLPDEDLGYGWTVVGVAAGGYHTCARLENRELRALKCWGGNEDGQLGLGDTAPRGDWGDSLPAVDLGTNRSAVALALGNAHSCALLDDNTVKCWGGNEFGELGLGYSNYRGHWRWLMVDRLPPVPVCMGPCPVGYSGSHGGPCSACLPGTYKATAGSGSCAACPSNSASAAGSHDVADCACDAGYARVDASYANPDVVQCGGTCGCSGSLAPGGVISDGEGDYSDNANCWWTISGASSGASPSVWFTSLSTESSFDIVYVEECADASFSSGVVVLATLSGTPALATYTATKQYLRVRFTSDDSNSEFRGFTASWSSRLCSVCEKGTYKNAPGSGSCAACPSHSASAAGSAVCACDARYTAASDGVSCSACVAGTFKGSVGRAVCETCPANANSSSGSALCQCSAGFTGADVGRGGVQCVRGGHVQERGGNSRVRDMPRQRGVLVGQRAVPVLGGVHGRGRGCVRGVLGGDVQGRGGVGELRGVPFKLGLRSRERRADGLRV
ncbi:hypothetical protein T484DRAFT_2302239 [Baffinella frigidus]|nr:hypothetical protein T484DRAFT_2302239 [Cryptophyta sp. CCMP2293]